MQVKHLLVFLSFPLKLFWTRESIPRLQMQSRDSQLSKFANFNILHDFK